MKYLLLFLISFQSYSMTFEHTNKIYQKIIKANKFVYVPKLKLVYSPKVNAHSGFSSITVNSAMLLFVKNDSEMALVLGHELAHYMLGHMISNYSNEFAADERGAKYARQSGYNSCKGALVILRLNSPNSPTHPSSSSRYAALGCN